jgi:hypothetical protein
MKRRRQRSKFNAGAIRFVIRYALQHPAFCQKANSSASLRHLCGFLIIHMYYIFRCRSIVMYHIAAIAGGMVAVPGTRPLQRLDRVGEATEENMVVACQITAD